MHQLETIDTTSLMIIIAKEIQRLAMQAAVDGDALVLLGAKQGEVIQASLV